MIGYLNVDSIIGIIHPTFHPMMNGSLIDKGSETDALNDALYVDVVGLQSRN